MPLELQSPAFARGGPLPARFAADHGNRSPPLAWTGAPRLARAFALIALDPDAPRRPFVHWLAWDIAGHLRGLPEGLAPGAVQQGLNDYGALGWGGPRPPPGRGAHRYVFRLFALDRPLGLAEGASRAELEAQLSGRELERAALTARYWRSR
jgi:Raf kinase inhibitor-like YbhB/YbcL family protein